MRTCGSRITCGLFYFTQRYACPLPSPAVAVAVHLAAVTVRGYGYRLRLPSGSHRVTRATFTTLHTTVAVPCYTLRLTAATTLLPRLPAVTLVWLDTFILYRHLRSTRLHTHTLLPFNTGYTPHVCLRMLRVHTLHVYLRAVTTRCAYRAVLLRLLRCATVPWFTRGYIRATRCHVAARLPPRCGLHYTHGCTLPHLRYRAHARVALRLPVTLLRWILDCHPYVTYYVATAVGLVYVWFVCSCRLRYVYHLLVVHARYVLPVTLPPTLRSLLPLPVWVTVATPFVPLHSPFTFTFFTLRGLDYARTRLPHAVATRLQLRSHAPSGLHYTPRLLRLPRSVTFGSAGLPYTFYLPVTTTHPHTCVCTVVYTAAYPRFTAFAHLPATGSVYTRFYHAFGCRGWLRFTTAHTAPFAVRYFTRLVRFFAVTHTTFICLRLPACMVCSSFGLGLRTFRYTRTVLARTTRLRYAFCTPTPTFTRLPHTAVTVAARGYHGYLPFTAFWLVPTPLRTLLRLHTFYTGCTYTTPAFYRCRFTRLRLCRFYGWFICVLRLLPRFPPHPAARGLRVHAVLLRYLPFAHTTAFGLHRAVALRLLRCGSPHTPHTVAAYRLFGLVYGSCYAPGSRTARYTTTHHYAHTTRWVRSGLRALPAYLWVLHFTCLYGSPVPIFFTCRGSLRYYLHTGCRAHHAFAWFTVLPAYAPGSTFTTVHIPRSATFYLTPRYHGWFLRFVHIHVYWLLFTYCLDFTVAVHCLVCLRTVVCGLPRLHTLLVACVIVAVGLHFAVHRYGSRHFAVCVLPLVLRGCRGSCHGCARCRATSCFTTHCHRDFLGYTYTLPHGSCHTLRCSAGSTVVPPPTPQFYLRLLPHRATHAHTVTYRYTVGSAVRLCGCYAVLPVRLVLCGYCGWFGYHTVTVYAYCTFHTHIYAHHLVAAHTTPTPPAFGYSCLQLPVTTLPRLGCGYYGSRFTRLPLHLRFGYIHVGSCYR